MKFILRFLVCIVLVMAFALPLKAQSAFEDALIIRRHLDSFGGYFYLSTQTRPIYDKYFGKQSDAVLDEMIGNNPYLKDLFTVVQASSGLEGKFDVFGQDHKSMLQNALAGVSGLNVSNMAFGLTDFLIERSRTELNTAFFIRMKDELNSEQFKMLRQLLPNTSAMLLVIGDDIYQYGLYLNAIQKAYERDMEELLPNVQLLLRNLAADTAVHSDKQMLELFQLGFEFAYLVYSGKHPAGLLPVLAESAAANQLARSEKYSNVAGGIRLAALLSEALRKHEVSGGYWVDNEEIKQLDDVLVLRIFLGLIYQKCLLESPWKEIVFITPAGLYPITDVLDAMAKEIKKINAFKTYIQEYSRVLKKVENNVVFYEGQLEQIRLNPKLSEKDRRQLMGKTMFELYRASGELIGYTFSLDPMPALADLGLKSSEWQWVKEMFSKMSNLSASLSAGQYSLSVVYLSMSLNELLPDVSNRPFISRFLKYGSFMASLVEAETPEQAKAVIEAAALPPGSYSVKRHSHFNVSLNGYFGGLAGHERIKGIEAGQIINNVSLSAPVGVHFGWGRVMSANKNPWSLGFFMPFIDLGTLASYRLGNDAAESTPEIKLHHILAPGVFLECGIGGTPLSLGFGVQMGPQLRKIQGEDLLTGATYWRIGGSLKVDIPLVTFYSSPSKK